MESFDTLIVGGGPAGMSCALELLDSKIGFVLFERHHKVGGQLWDIVEKINNFAGGVFDNGAQAADRLVQSSALIKKNIIYGSNIEHIDLRTNTVKVGGETYRGKALVLATGQRLKQLHLPGESMFTADILYKARGREPDLRGKKVAIVGGGDSALLTAITLADLCSEVTLLHRGKQFRARPDVIATVQGKKKIKKMLETEIDSLSGSPRLSALQVVSRESGQVIDLPVDFLMVKIGYTPNTEMFRNQVKMTAEGRVLIDPWCETSVAGVFAIGDIAEPGYPRMATAVGHGMMAASKIRRMLGQTV